MASPPMNKYWIPHLDIHKKVITQELQYYLGPDATVRPYTREEPRKDRSAAEKIEGFITLEDHTMTRKEVKRPENEFSKLANCLGMQQIADVTQMRRGTGGSATQKGLEGMRPTAEQDLGGFKMDDNGLFRD
ncbi:hypothetical protein Daesc_007923 [Daldinia eschscholtzii]|uniref:Uncharacterized protein n=1 Tax=Daldinia eschscholtzii TaxID=292717 RepID=A0AAX6MFA8_9PEZI